MKPIFRTLLCLSALSFAVTGTALAAGETFSAVPGMGGPSNANAPEGSPVNYQVDDGTNENNIGLNATATGTATQFMWFNRFDIAPADLPLQIDQVRIFWDPTTTGPPQVGNAISIEIFSDNDANPANGAVHVYTENDTIAQVGTTFDVYNLTTPPGLPTALNLLVGVVDRWITSGVSPSTFPAAIDQTATAGRSWVAATATGTPPVPPVVPSTGLFGTIDSFGLAGNWLIRATGTVTPVELLSFGVD